VNDGGGIDDDEWVEALMTFVMTGVGNNSANAYVFFKTLLLELYLLIQFSNRNYILLPLMSHFSTIAMFLDCLATIQQIKLLGDSSRHFVSGRNLGFNTVFFETVAETWLKEDHETERSDHHTV
jgi:hypothetical protein